MFLLKTDNFTDTLEFGQQNGHCTYTGIYKGGGEVLNLDPKPETVWAPAANGDHQTYKFRWVSNEH